MFRAAGISKANEEAQEKNQGSEVGKEHRNSKPWKHLGGQLSKPQTLSYHVGGTEKRLFQFCVQGQVDNIIPKSWHPARIQALYHISDKKFDRRLESCMLSCPLPEVTAHVKKKKAQTAFSYIQPYSPMVQ